MAEQDGFDDALYGVVLVVPGHLAGHQIEWLQQVGHCGLGPMRRRRQPLPKLVGRGVAINLTLGAGGVVDLDDAMAVGRVGELQVEHLRVLAGLLHPGFGRQAEFLRFDDGRGKSRR